MYTKMVLGCFLLLCVVGYVSACNKQSDCPLTHCCAKKAFVEGEYNCVLYRQKGDVCLPGGLDEILYDEKYDINCPCQPGLSCMNYETTDGRGGFIANGYPTCRNVTEDRILQRQNRIYSNSIAGASAFSYGRRRK